ncbi:hypothetical protein CIB95_03585 [Lottiidibacillus patelloidae]|uniref:Uncharacterized protein n=1 Tax=Lottiidibacillus patelloidae TaxID=2670334 RepID=A0A263BYL3_9BACI|nr:hypothetical protein [Lottiidibacillus patelloidae]OZM58662.1 hypothetical protein CIB95_03585 [Lottiidibacillus patelloidae]
MLLFLFLVVLTIAGVIEFIRKYVLHMKDPDAKELLEKVEQKRWFQELLEVEEYKKQVELQKKSGLLKDPHYLQKLLEHEGTVLGFITFVKNRN